MKIYERTFHRLFSRNFYKNLTLPLGEMSFTKDFVNTTRGDLYPVIDKSEDCLERVENNRYMLEAGSVTRLMGQFFPYATYEIAFSGLSGRVGLRFHIAQAEAEVTYDGQNLRCSTGEAEAVGMLDSLIVSCRPGFFDVYTRQADAVRFLRTFGCEAFGESHDYSAFSYGWVAVTAAGCVCLCRGRFYIDCGISQADIRPIRYENGRAMVEQGKLWLTMSIRMQAQTFQGVFSWVPGTSQLELTGALFYDCGDGKWCGDVAASVLYHRKKQQWLLWVCAFSHGHILAHSAFEGDPRFGVNVIDVELMEKPEGAALTDFYAVTNDEDPDFFYDEARERWLMSVCRVDPSVRGYRYMFFESSQPFDGYRYIGCGQDGAETGGSFVNLEGETVFLCGNSFQLRANYRVYTKAGMQEAKFDFDDGGFRGWGTLIPVTMGSRTRYFWLTFDRHNGSDYNWSYGNLYCFEAM